MNESLYTYKTIEGIPDSAVIQQLLRVYDQLFEDAKLDFFVNRIHTKQDLIVNLCYDNSELIAFKLGYHYDEKTLYSWVGGVLSKYRKKGIAQKLMELQHQAGKEKGYEKVRTKSMNRFKPKIIFEKNLS